jgi:hypothetical protein
MSVEPTGAVHVQFGEMAPITYQAEAIGATVRGEILYRGSISGDLDLDAVAPSKSDPGATTGAASGSASVDSVSRPPAAGSSPSVGQPVDPTGYTGAWQPTGEVTWGDLRLTVRVVEPFAATVIDDLRVGDVTGDQTTKVGNAVDLQPLLRPGTYRCDYNDRLMVRPSRGDPAIVWMFQRSLSTTEPTNVQPSSSRSPS